MLSGACALLAKLQQYCDTLPLQSLRMSVPATPSAAPAQPLQAPPTPPPHPPPPPPQHPHTPHPFSRPQVRHQLHLAGLPRCGRRADIGQPALPAPGLPPGHLHGLQGKRPAARRPPPPSHAPLRCGAAAARCSGRPAHPNNTHADGLVRGICAFGAPRTHNTHNCPRPRPRPPVGAGAAQLAAVLPAGPAHPRLLLPGALQVHRPGRQRVRRLLFHRPARLLLAQERGVVPPQRHAGGARGLRAGVRGWVQPCGCGGQEGSVCRPPGPPCMLGWSARLAPARRMLAGCRGLVPGLGDIGIKAAGRAGPSCWRATGQETSRRGYQRVSRLGLGSSGPSLPLLPPLGCAGKSVPPQLAAGHQVLLGLLRPHMPRHCLQLISTLACPSPQNTVFSVTCFTPSPPPSPPPPPRQASCPLRPSDHAQHA